MTSSCCPSRSGWCSPPSPGTRGAGALVELLLGGRRAANEVLRGACVLLLDVRAILNDQSALPVASWLTQAWEPMKGVRHRPQGKEVYTCTKRQRGLVPELLCWDKCVPVPGARRHQHPELADLAPGLWGGPSWLQGCLSHDSHNAAGGCTVHWQRQTLDGRQPWQSTR